MNRFVFSNFLSIKTSRVFVPLRSVGLRGQDAPFSGTMAEVKAKLIDHFGLEEGYKPVPKSREHLLKHVPKLEDLPPRSMQESFTYAIIPFSVEKTLQDKYVALFGHIRMGRLMEDMDLFGVWLCYKHLKIPKLPEGVHMPYTFVTILVDKITFTDIQTVITEDIRLSGHISWVGRSSMEVVVWLEQKEKDVYKKITRALFLFAARNATNTSAAPVNPILPASDEEKSILSGGEKRKKRRQKVAEESIFKVQPNDCEQSIMYELYKRTTPLQTMELNVRSLPKNCRWMSDSYIVNTFPCFPEYRNAQYTVFGGFLMRNGLEISWVAARLYNKSPAKIKHICDISFRSPVSVSSFIKMVAYVVYTQEQYIEVMTVADILDSTTGEQMTSNIFYYTFKAPSAVPEVLPRSYQETMWYIQGRRKFRYSLGIDEE
ncbi:acyl-coenzyme A thioesterase 9, mitochondrial-like [Teleopsis dalmanni]|uniref:acyl-coenzyme A thioesterase 9, mitochondrial-like n=1 Tax=Teleopsis dalmanni TaxID=139649 RepID=UPI0018CE8F63|nr:acyl-coenzyme A thioesterase 9, mitochondrial-like [Teleopsis dalmanni]